MKKHTGMCNTNTDTGLSDSLHLSGMDLPTFIFLYKRLQMIVRRESVCSGLLCFSEQRPPSLQVCQFNHESDVLSEDSTELRDQQKRHAFPSFSYYNKAAAA